MHVLGTVSLTRDFHPLDNAHAERTTKASVSKLSFDTDANYFVLFSKQNLPQVISALEKIKV